jgi:hypothetical protein
VVELGVFITNTAKTHNNKKENLSPKFSYTDTKQRQDNHRKSCPLRKRENYSCQHSLMHKYEESLTETTLKPHPESRWCSQFNPDITGRFTLIQCLAFIF